MNIKAMAEALLKKPNHEVERKMVIADLKNGLQHNKRWNDEHKKKIRKLVEFLQSDSMDIKDLKIK